MSREVLPTRPHEFRARVPSAWMISALLCGVCGCGGGSDSPNPGGGSAGTLSPSGAVGSSGVGSAAPVGVGSNGVNSSVAGVGTMPVGTVAGMGATGTGSAASGPGVNTSAGMTASVAGAMGAAGSAGAGTAAAAGTTALQAGSGGAAGAATGGAGAMSGVGGMGGAGGAVMEASAAECTAAIMAAGSTVTDCEVCLCQVGNCQAELAALDGDALGNALVDCSSAHACTGQCCVCGTSSQGAMCASDASDFGMGPCAVEVQMAAGATPMTGLDGVIANMEALMANCTATGTDATNSCTKALKLEQCSKDKCEDACPSAKRTCP